MFLYPKVWSTCKIPGSPLMDANFTLPRRVSGWRWKLPQKMLGDSKGKGPGFVGSSILNLREWWFKGIVFQIIVGQQCDLRDSFYFYTIVLSLFYYLLDPFGLIGSSHIRNAWKPTCSETLQNWRGLHNVGFWKGEEGFLAVDTGICFMLFSIGFFPIPD